MPHEPTTVSMAAAGKVLTMLEWITYGHFTSLLVLACTGYKNRAKIGEENGNIYIHAFSLLSPPTTAYKTDMDLTSSLLNQVHLTRTLCLRSVPIRKESYKSFFLRFTKTCGLCYTLEPCISIFVFAVRSFTHFFCSSEWMQERDVITHSFVEEKESSGGRNMETTQRWRTCVRGKKWEFICGYERVNLLLFHPPSVHPPLLRPFLSLFSSSFFDKWYP